MPSLLHSFILILFFYNISSFYLACFFFPTSAFSIHIPLAIYSLSFPIFSHLSVHISINTITYTHISFLSALIKSLCLYFFSFATFQNAILKLLFFPFSLFFFLFFRFSSNFSISFFVSPSFPSIASPSTYISFLISSLLFPFFRFLSFLFCFPF